jgi:predicted RNA-binding protein YlxR (DUF448 family)
MVGESPRRRCIVTRASLPKDDLIRFVVGPDHDVVPDVAGKLPGRGLWLSARRDIVDQACSSNLFAKACGREVSSAADMSDRLERLLTARCLELLGLARRAGKCVAGFEKVRRYVRTGRGGVVLLAADGSDDAERNLGRMPSGWIGIRAFEAAELGAVFGRERVVYVAVGRGAMADRLAGEARRLEGFRFVPDAGKLN